MHRILTIMALVLCLAYAPLALAAETQKAPAPDPAKEAQRLVQAERYWNAASMDSQITSSLKRLVQAVPEDRRQGMSKAVDDVLGKGDIKKKVLEAMTKTFTLPELTALANFYDSPEGKSVMAKMQPFMESVSQVVIEEVRVARAAQGPQAVGVFQKKPGAPPSGQPGQAWPQSPTAAAPAKDKAPAKAEEKK